MLPDSPPILKQTQECCWRDNINGPGVGLFAFLACVKVNLSCQLGEIWNHLGRDLWGYPIYFKWGQKICPPRARILNGVEGRKQPEGKHHVLLPDREHSVTHSHKFLGLRPSYRDERKPWVQTTLPSFTDFTTSFYNTNREETEMACLSAYWGAQLHSACRVWKQCICVSPCRLIIIIQEREGMLIWRRYSKWQANKQTSKQKIGTDIVVCPCNPSTEEVEAGWGVKGQSQLQSELEASLGCMRSCQRERERYFDWLIDLEMRKI